LLRVGYDLKEDVDICARQSVSLITPIEKTETRNKLTSVTQRRQLLNPRRVWHSARVKIRLLTRFVSVVYTVAVLMAETAFARSYFSWIRVDKSCNAGIWYHVFVVSKKNGAVYGRNSCCCCRRKVHTFNATGQRSAGRLSHADLPSVASDHRLCTSESMTSPIATPSTNAFEYCSTNQFLTTQSCRHHEQSRLRSSLLPPQNALLRYVLSWLGPTTQLLRNTNKKPRELHMANVSPPNTKMSARTCVRRNSCNWRTAIWYIFHREFHESQD